MKTPGEIIFSVSELTGAIKHVLEERFERITVSGEISNFHKHTSGHLYFTLKDAAAQLAGVMFRGNALKMFFKPQNGMQVVCRGSVSVYEPRGTYQLIATDMQPLGEGALQVAFERLKKKLFEEGLFDDARKKLLPDFPQTIALVTSPVGAAVRDMVSVIQRRNRTVKLILVPVPVQGAGAAEQIANGIDMCNSYGNIDVIIVGRGGGSIEDLWAFNEEEVARAIFRSRIPVVSAVGHEVDYTIADFVSDLRAATPSAAGEIVVPTRDEIVGMLLRIASVSRNLVDSRIRSMSDAIARFRSIRSLTRGPIGRIQTYRQMLDEKSDRMHNAIALHSERLLHLLMVRKQQLHSHDAQRILQKGFALVRKNGAIIRSQAEIRVHDRIDIQFRDGIARARVEGEETES